MNIYLLPFTVVWMILAVIVIGLIIYRKKIAVHEDDTLHISDHEAALVSQQAATAQKLEMIDRWGKALTAIALIYGLALGAGYLYQS